MTLKLFNKNIVNLRPMGVCFTIMLLSVYATVNFGLFVPIIAFLLLFIAVIVRLICRRKIGDKRVFRYVNLAFVCVFITSFITLNGLIDLTATKPIDGAVTGRVVSISNNDYGQSATLENVTVDGDKIDGGVRVYLSSSDNFKVADIVKFDGELSVKSYPKSKTFASNDLKYRVKYNASIDKFDSVTEGVMTTVERLKFNVSSMLDGNMSTSAKGITLGMLFGDTNSMNSDLLTLYRHSGVAHVFAVSGLHIGVLYAFLYGVLSKLKCNKLLIFAIITTTLFYYCYICNNSASSLRASITMTIFMIIQLLCKRKDNISIICTAGTVIILLSPLSAMTVGFVLSFACAIGIVALYKPMCEWWKADGKISRTIAFSLTVSIVSTAFSAYYFSYVSIFSVVLNMLIVPVMSFMYIVNIIFVVLSYFGINLLPISGFCLDLITLLFRYIDHFLPLSFDVRISFIIPIIILLMTLINKYIMYKKWRSNIQIFLCGVLIVGFIAL